MLNFILRKLQNVQVCRLCSLKAHAAAERDRGKRVRQKAPFFLKCVQTHAAALKSTYPGVAQLVARLLWENTTSRIKNSITGCSAVGSAPALGAGCRRFESCHSDHVGASFVSLAPTYFISQSALTPLLLLSKSNPLRWASIWYGLSRGG